MNGQWSFTADWWQWILTWVLAAIGASRVIRAVVEHADPRVPEDRDDLDRLHR